MTTSTIEEKTQVTAAPGPEPKPTAKATKRKPVGTPAKAKSAKKATRTKKGADTAPQAPAVAPKKAKAGKRASKSEKPAQARQDIKTAYSGQARSLRPVCSGVARNSRFGVTSVRFFM